MEIPDRRKRKEYWSILILTTEKEDKEHGISDSNFSGFTVISVGSHAKDASQTGLGSAHGMALRTSRTA